MRVATVTASSTGLFLYPWAKSAVVALLICYDQVAAVLNGSILIILPFLAQIRNAGNVYGIDCANDETIDNVHRFFGGGHPEVCVFCGALWVTRYTCTGRFL